MSRAQFCVKSKAHGGHFVEVLGIKRVDLNININLKEVMKEYKVFCTKRDKIYRKMSEIVLNCWLEELRSCNDC
ncbi:MAG: hypothetical protein ABIN61_09165 [candidate division WOR-3 bacterium]